MFIYNVTTHVEPSIEKQWIDWMHEEHIPQMIKTGKFTKALLLKVKTEDDDDLGGKSYAAQFQCVDQSSFEAYLKEDAGILRKSAQEKFGEKVLSFRTELELISTF